MTAALRCPPKYGTSSTPRPAAGFPCSGRLPVSFSAPSPPRPPNAGYGPPRPGYHNGGGGLLHRGYNRVCDQLNAIVLSFLFTLALCAVALQWRPPPPCAPAIRAGGLAAGTGGHAAAGGGLFLFIGVLSAGGNAAQRAAVRAAWATAAQASGQVREPPRIAAGCSDRGEEHAEWSSRL